MDQEDSFGFNLDDPPVSPTEDQEVPANGEDINMEDNEREKGGIVRTHK